MMRQTMRSIDAGLGSMTQHDTTLTAPTDSIVHTLAVWLQDGVPRKLVAVDSTIGSAHNRETDVWFMGGDVAVVLQVADAYAFDSDRIVLWTDETLLPRADVTMQQAMAKQTELTDAVQRWLGVLRIKPGS
jgi:hypothetical protein